MARLDPSPWNLGAPLLVLAACGPLVPFDDGDTGSASVTEGNDDRPNPSGTSPTGPNPTGPNPTTMTTSVECYGDGDCPPGYRCQGGYCYYEGYCNDGTCCSPECGWYECFGNIDCPPAYACLYNQCNPIDIENECAIISTDSQIPIAIDGGVLSLAFVDGNGDLQRDLLIGQDGAVQHVDGLTLAITTIDAGAVFPLDIATGDLDGDGDDDAVLIDGSVGGGMRVVVHDDTWVALDIADSAQNLQQVALADIEGDALPDIYGRSDSNGTFVAFNYGDSISAAQYVFEPALSLAVGNLDDDGFVDAVVNNYANYALVGGVAFSIYELYDPTGSEPRIVAVGDFNGSPPDDVVMLQGVNGAAIATAFVGFAPDSSAYHSYWQVAMVAAETVDINGDGYDDVVAAASGYGIVVAFGAPVAPPDLFDCVQYVSSPIAAEMVSVGDMTGDGRPDIAVSDGTQVIVLAQSG